MFRPRPTLFFTLLMRLERKVERTSKCRDALEILVPVKQCDLAKWLQTAKYLQKW